MKKTSVVNQYGKGENNLPMRVCDWMNEHTRIIEEHDDGFVFGVSIKETEDYIKEIKGTDTAPSYVYSIRSKAMLLYRYNNEDCDIKWIE